MTARRHQPPETINEKVLGVVLRGLLVLNKDLPGFPALDIPEGRLEDRARNIVQALMIFDIKERS